MLAGSNSVAVKGTLRGLRRGLRDFQKSIPPFASFCSDEYYVIKIYLSQGLKNILTTSK